MIPTMHLRFVERTHHPKGLWVTEKVLQQLWVAEDDPNTRDWRDVELVNV